MRSNFPDLIYSDTVNKRVDGILGLINNDRVLDSKNIQLERVTVFLTHKCNLRCVYCNGPHINNSLAPEARRDMLKADMTVALFRRLVSQWKERCLKYIHFTGGEATFHPEIVEFIKIAKKNDMISALTTNGTARKGLFKEMIENGLYEIRISIDSCDKDTFDQIVRVGGSFDRVKNNIQEITRLRDEAKADVFLILNATVGLHNVLQLERTIDVLLSFQPDDIKLLTAAQERKLVPNYSSDEMVNYLIKTIRRENPDKELLKDKITHLFRDDVFGFADIKLRRLMDRCYIPLAERIIDARGVYPCSIYLRYNGRPIAKADASFEEQHRGTLDFLYNHSCKDDEICIDNCTRCTRDFNICMNKEVRGLKSRYIKSGRFTRRLWI